MASLRQLWAGFKALLVLTVLCGVVYPLVMTGFGQAFLHHQADGSPVVVNGQVVGSSLIGQQFSGSQWFWGRPSASNYAGDTSGGTNLSQQDPRQLQAVSDHAGALRAANPDAPSDIPADALTASGSGLDPDISPAYAHWQVPRVAKARGLNQTQVDGLVDRLTKPTMWGLLGQPRVNVLQLNQELNRLSVH